MIGKAQRKECRNKQTQEEMEGIKTKEKQMNKERIK
jgi:hypothetical protein